MQPSFACRSREAPQAVAETPPCGLGPGGVAPFEEKADKLPEIEIEKRWQVQNGARERGVLSQKQETIAEVEVEIHVAVPGRGGGHLVQKRSCRLVQYCKAGTAGAEAEVGILIVRKIRGIEPADSVLFGREGSTR